MLPQSRRGSNCADPMPSARLRTGLVLQHSKAFTPTEDPWMESSTPSPYAPPQSDLQRSDGADPSLQELADLGTRLAGALLDGLIYTIALLPMLMTLGLLETGQDTEA